MDGRAREGRGTTLACGEWGETRAMRALHELTIVEAGEALRAGSVTVTALTEAVPARLGDAACPRVALRQVREATAPDAWSAIGQRPRRVMAGRTEDPCGHQELPSHHRRRA